MAVLLQFNEQTSLTVQQLGENTGKTHYKYSSNFPIRCLKSCYSSSTTEIYIICFWFYFRYRSRKPATGVANSFESKIIDMFRWRKQLDWSICHWIVLGIQKVCILYLMARTLTLESHVHDSWFIRDLCFMYTFWLESKSKSKSKSRNAMLLYEGTNTFCFWLSIAKNTAST